MARPNIDRVSLQISALAYGKSEMIDSKFLDSLGMDAHEWAKAFAQLLDGKIVQGDSPDSNDDVAVNYGTLIGWFANAIMAGYDRGYERGANDGLVADVRLMERRATITPDTQR